MVELVEARVTYKFRASPERVFDAWLDPETARIWMSMPAAGMPAFNIRRVEIDPRVGGKFTFSDQREDGEAVHWGYYRVINRPTELSFTWFTSEEEEEENTSVVTMTIDRTDDGCVVQLVHSMDARWAEWIKQTERGWTVMLTKIEGALKLQ
jgi:uncharacterized protein YndB with AHSA1/START domain